MYEEFAEAPLTSMEGLSHFYEERTSPPKKVTVDDYMAMTEPQRRHYDESRLWFMHRNLNVGTDAYFEASRRLDSLIRQNRLTRHDKGFLGISGEPYTGKSHLLFTLARATARRMSRDIPDWRDLGYVPVVVITVPSPTTTKGILRQLAAFFGYPATSRVTEDELRRRLITAMQVRRTQVLAFDEAQNMAQGTRTLEDAKNLLRELSQKVRATQIYCGIDLRDSGLLGDISGRQLSERLRMIELRPHVVSSPGAQEAWRQTIDAFEDGLCLIGHRKGSLRKLDELLLYLTDGVLGELANLLIGAATSLIEARAVENFGGEHLTAELIRSMLPSEAALARELEKTLPPRS